MIRPGAVVVTVCATGLSLRVTLALPPRSVWSGAGPEGGAYHAHARAWLKDGQRLTGDAA
jgi:hypothetical protein